jgi:hypothetical protein
MRWLDDVESDLKRMKVKGWKEKTGCRGGQGSPRAVTPKKKKREAVRSHISKDMPL